MHHFFMIQTSSSTLPERSRLVRLLTELSVAKVGPGEQNLAEQLGRLIGVSDSIALSRSLGTLPLNKAKSVVDSVDEVRNEILRCRREMMRIIVTSFAANPEGIGIQAPSVSTGTRASALQTYEPYQRFYSMHQAEMAGSVQQLRVQVRSCVSGFSVELHQLAELDEMLSDSLAGHTAKLFNVTPKLLESRFKQLLEAHLEKSGGVNDTEPSQWLIPGGWLELFYKDMQELLLAELDVRLQPVVGLLEALNEQ